MNDKTSLLEKKTVSFDHFSPGDVAIFERSFSEADFSTFSALSGDRNPLHHDIAHAATSAFGRPIVPLHLTLAPLSMVAGMIFPGKPSLYLGHEVRAAQPVFYGDVLRYSARVEAVNIANRILMLRVIAFRDVEIVLDTTMRVQATAAEWDTESSVPVIHTVLPARALVTGSSGEIGRAVALALGKAGWSLLLQDRGNDERRGRLRQVLDTFPVCYEFVTANLATPEGRAELLGALRQHDDVEAVVHTASGGVSASLEELVATNFTVMKNIADTTLPSMLARQKGRLLFISSSAMIRGVPGWEDYVAAKTMTTGFLSRIDKRLSSCGVRALTLMPGFVATRFSLPYRGDAPALLPQEVAETVVSMIDTPGEGAMVLEVGRRQEGTFGFHVASAAGDTASSPRATHNPHTQHSTPVLDSSGSTRASVADVVRRRLRLPPSFDLGSGGLGITPGWDSLSQIELLLEIESAFRISFTSAEIQTLTQYSELEAAIIQKASMQ